MLDFPRFRIPTIVRGEDISLPIYMGRDQFTHELIDVSTATQITATLLNYSGVIQNFTLTSSGIVVLQPNLISVVISSAASLLFKKSGYECYGDRQIRVSYVIGGLTTIMNPSPVVTIIDPPFAAQP